MSPVTQLTDNGFGALHDLKDKEMFNWFKKNRKADPGKYDGTSIFLECPDCHNYHKAPEIPAFSAAITQACSQMQATTKELYAEFDVLQPDGRWDTLPEEGIFYFTNADGRRSFANYSLVGSWIEDTHSWLWGWNLPETLITTATRRAPDLARAKGEAEDWPVLTTPMLMLNECEAWHMTDFAASLAGHPMVYRAKVNQKAWAFFAIDQLSWEN